MTSSNANTTTDARSTRKPHNHIAGYVCERKHPLGGHLVIYDATKQSLGDIEDLGGRWVVVWEGCPSALHQYNASSVIGPGFTNMPAARSFFKSESQLVQGYDWGGFYSDGTEGEDYWPTS